MLNSEYMLSEINRPKNEMQNKKAQSSGIKKKMYVYFTFQKEEQL